jgi:hypothetical protein
VPLEVVNVIPAVLSAEAAEDSECSVSANPANPNEIALSAFTNDPASSGTAPIFVSTNGGATWALAVCVPGGNSTGDISLRFGGTSGRLYGGILRMDNLNLNILRADAFPPVVPMTILINRAGPDQPWVETAWVGAPGNATVDRVYVADNNGTAEVQLSLDAATAAAPAGFAAAVDVETRSGFDRPSVRTAVHRAGVVYGTFVGVRPGGSDIVVVRDDNWGSGGFANLNDPGDSLAGQRVVSGVVVPPVGTLLGSERVSSRIAIAVDPRRRQRVYVAWCDGAVTAASPFTLHLRRSEDRGQTWTSDLRTIQNVTNPGLAVNIRGVVGLMYQQLTTPAAGDRWETHFEISDDRFASVRQDILIADVRDLGGVGQPTIGDYANLVAVGKDFYGAFAGFNEPIAANFPNGVTYLRNVDWSSQQLRATDGVTVVTPSIDPFFFHFSDVARSDDFYVRDWTDSAVSGDNGVEPSTHPRFWATSDVWNRRGPAPGPFVNDQPSNEDAGNGAGKVGDNWAFARVRRRAAGSPGGPTVVTARFLVAKLGTGSNYVDASSADPDVSFLDPDPTLTFPPAQVGPKTTAAFHWHLNPVASTHLCLAVEISSPNDPFAGQSLRGRAPGWPDQDLEILDDNNKAQRNMGLSTTPARGVEAAEMALFGIVHNAANVRRDLVLGYTLDEGVVRRVKRVSIQVQRGRRVDGKRDGRIIVRGMEPGENRWVGVAFTPPRGQPSTIHVVDFFEIVGEAALNGFSLGARLDTQKEALRHVVERHRSVFTRLSAAWDIEGAEAEAAAARRAARRLPSVSVWLKGLDERWEPISKAVAAATDRNDGASVRRDLKQLAVALQAGKEADALVHLGSLLERLDILLTMRQLEVGDRADILQTVRWQAELFLPPSPFAADTSAQAIVAPSLEFADAYAERRVDDADYPELVRGSLDVLGRVEGTEEADGFSAAVAGVREALDLGDFDALQGAHRRLLLVIAGLRGEERQAESNDGES